MTPTTQPIQRAAIASKNCFMPSTSSSSDGPVDLLDGRSRHACMTHTRQRPYDQRTIAGGLILTDNCSNTLNWSFKGPLGTENTGDSDVM